MEKKIRVINSDFGNDEDGSNPFSVATHTVKLSKSKSTGSVSSNSSNSGTNKGSSRYSLRANSVATQEDFFPPSPELRKNKKKKSASVSSSSQPVTDRKSVV